MIKKIINGKAMLTADQAFSRYDIEAWLIRRLGSPPCITAGLTTFAERQQRISDFILANDFRDLPVTSKEPETFGQFYIRFYGAALIAIPVTAQPSATSKTKQPKGKEHAAIT
jgi:hypothetical protein